MASSFRRFVGRVAVGALAVAVPVVLAPVAASAAATDLFISEYIEGSSNNKALEIYNGTGAAGGPRGRRLQRPDVLQRLGDAGPTIGLTGSVAAGDVFVLAHAGRRRRGPRPWRTRPQRVELVQRRRRRRPAQGRRDRSGPRLDRAGRRRPRHRVGHAASTSTVDNTLRRKAAVCAGDTDRERRVRPRGGVGRVRRPTPSTASVRHTAACPRRPRPRRSTSVVPAERHRGRGRRPPASVTFSEAVTAACLARSPSPARSRLGAGRPSPASNEGRTYTLDPAADLAVGESCTRDGHAAAGHRRRHQRPAGHHGGRPHLHLHRRRPLHGRADGHPGRSRARARPPPTTGGRAPCGASSWATTRAPRRPCAASTSRSRPVTATRPPPTRSSSSTAAQPTSSPSATSWRPRRRSAEFQGQTQISTVRRHRRVRHRRDGAGDRGRAADGERHGVREATRACSCACRSRSYVTEHFQLGRFGEVLVSSGGRLQQPTNIVAPGAAGARPAGGEQPQPDPRRRRVQRAEPRPDRLRPGRRPAERDEHAARRRHHHRRHRRHDLHLGRQLGQPERLPACDRSTPSVVSGLRGGQPAALGARPRSVVTSASRR